MRTATVVKRNVTINVFFRTAHCVVSAQVHFFVLDAAPDSLVKQNPAHAGFKKYNQGVDGKSLMALLEANYALRVFGSCIIFDCE